MSIFLLKQFFDPRVWGFFLPLFLIILFMRGRHIGEEKRAIVLAPVIVSILISMAMILWVYMASLYEGIAWTLEGWVELGLNRFLIPSVVLAIITMVMFISEGLQNAPRNRLGVEPREKETKVSV